MNWLMEVNHLAVGILSESIIPDLHKHYAVKDERYYPMAKIEKAIQDLEQAIADKQIYNVRWEEIKSSLNGAYHSAVKDKIGSRAPGSIFSDAPDYIHQLPGYAKKTKQPSDMLDFWVKVAGLLAAAKAHIVKGRKPNPNAKPKPDEVIVRNWTPALDMLEDRLKDIIKGTIKEFKGQIEQQMIGKAQKIWHAMEQHGIHKDMDLYKYDKEFSNSPFADPMFDRISRQRVADYPQREVEAIAAKQAQKIADQSAEHFVSKNKFKLAAFLKHKQIKDIKVMSMSVSNGVIHSQMRFTFEDGSEFTVQNQMVYGSTQQGTPFVRYPTTFHDVLIDGQRMSGPSELKIYKAFGISGAVPKEGE